MKKFILIDQSITGESGHYLVYARSVLDCAINSGFDPVLCVNKRYCGISLPQYHLYHAFTYTSLESLSSYRIRTGEDSLSVRYLWGGVLKPTVQKIFRILLGKNYSKLRKALYPSRKEIKEESPEYAYKAKCFAKDFAELLDTLNIESSDIVFLPTISYVELTGLGQVLRKYTHRVLPTIHVLFRWNPFSGTLVRYKEELCHLQYIQQCFQACEDLYQQELLKFYTDSDRLTEQYNQFSHCKFITLPIPHTYYEGSNTRYIASHKRGDWILTYLGDARSEKGFQYLPYLVKNLSENHICFHIQANFNIPGGEAGISSCRKQLQQGKNVTLYKKPLSPEVYADLLFNTDILLILYDWAQYYARSSGIFAEAMSAGIPAIVPANTWMAMEICKGRYKRLKNYISAFGIKTIELSIRDMYADVEPEYAVSGNLILMLQADWSFSDDSIRVEIVIQHKESPLEYSIVEFMERVGNEECFLLFSVSATEKIKQIKICSAYNRSTPHILSLKIIQLSYKGSLSWKICGIFDNIEHCPALIEAMINEYDAIRDSTVAFSKEWRNFHNPQRLLYFLRESN